MEGHRVGTIGIRHESEMQHNTDYLIMHFIISVTIEWFSSSVARCAHGAVPALL